MSDNQPINYELLSLFKPPEFDDYRLFSNAVYAAETQIFYASDEPSRNQAIARGISELNAMHDMTGRSVVFMGNCLYPYYDPVDERFTDRQLWTTRSPHAGICRGIEFRLVDVVNEQTAEVSQEYQALWRVDIQSVLLPMELDGELTIDQPATVYVGLNRGRIKTVDDIEEIYTPNPLEHSTSLAAIHRRAKAMASKQHSGSYLAKFLAREAQLTDDAVFDLAKKAKIIGQTMLVSSQRAYTIDRTPWRQRFVERPLPADTLAVCLGLTTRANACQADFGIDWSGQNNHAGLFFIIDVLEFGNQVGTVPKLWYIPIEDPTSRLEYEFHDASE